MDISKSSPPDSASLRDLIVRQFVLHEIKHCRPSAAEDRGIGSTVPTAHTLADVYKCLHQGEFGVGHSIENPQQFGYQLAYELLRCESPTRIPVLEDVSLHKTVFRINLAPYKQRFRSDDSTACAQLLRVCLDSASVPQGDQERFLATLDRFRELNNAQGFVAEGITFAFEPPMVDQFLTEVAHFVDSYGTVPVLSHSPIYKKLNSPSYRVADSESLADSPLAFLLNEME